MTPRLDPALDEVNSRFGTFAAVAAGRRFKRQWRLRSEMRSPAPAMRIDEVPRVRTSRTEPLDSRPQPRDVLALC